MTSLNKILGLKKEEFTEINTSEFYKNLFDRVKSSIKMTDSSIDDELLINKSKEIYLSLCKYVDCKCLDKIYAPIEDAREKLYQSNPSGKMQGIKNYS